MLRSGAIPRGYVAFFGFYGNVPVFSDRGEHAFRTVGGQTVHEVTLAQELVSMIENVARDHGADTVSAATLELGELSCAQPEALGFAFEIVRRGTIADGCKLVFRRTPLTVRCPSCGYQGPGDSATPGCPGCSAVPVEVVSGRDIRLVSIDVDDAANADTMENGNA